MSATMLSALLLQAVSVVLLRHRLGKAWLRRPAVILVLASVVYQGVSPVLLSVPSIRAADIYRNGIAPQYADDAVLLLSAAMLAFTLGYLLTRPERAPVAAPDVPAITRALDWRLLALCCLPLAVLTYTGRGYNSGVTSASASLTGSLAAEFFVILTVLAAFSFVLRHGRRWFLPVLALQSVLLAAAGERTPVIADAIVLAVLLASAGVRPSARQLGIAGALTLAAVLAITGVRAEHGRMLYASDSGLSARLGGLASGVSAPAVTAGGSLADQAAMRLDGVSFTAAILQSGHSGQPRLSLSGVPQSLLIAVPSALWPSKVAYGGLNPAQAEADVFGLQQVNFLPGLPGLYAGFLAPFWLIAFLGFLGLLAGHGERWLLGHGTPAGMILLAAAVTAALTYEAGLPAMLVTVRTGAVLALALRMACAVMPVRVRRARAPRPAG